MTPTLWVGAVIVAIVLLVAIVILYSTGDER